jgi:hypothetical protein
MSAPRVRGAPRRVSPNVDRGNSRMPPRAPWGAFPLSELTVLLAITAAIYGLLAWGSRSAVLALAAAACLGSLAGLEVAIREHLAGYRSHTMLLAAVGAVAVLTGAELATRSPLVALAIAVGTFLAAAALLWRAFERRRATGSASPSAISSPRRRRTAPSRPAGRG